VSRRRRTLTGEDRALWDRVRASATPLRFAPPEAPPPLVPLPPPQPTPMPVRAKPATPKAPAGPARPGAAPPATGPAMDRRRFEKMRRGRMEPEARLDLHGLTAGPAHAALTRFILGAETDGRRLVLVITGKGRVPDADALAPQRHGILRHSVPHWLSAPPLVTRVLEVAPAHARHGGAGAYYVYLRRPR
jgi:DNA-nicking Smr family endonuclease